MYENYRLIALAETVVMDSVSIQRGEMRNGVGGAEGR
jgi:hypothetical protein